MSKSGDLRELFGNSIKTEIVPRERQASQPVSPFRNEAIIAGEMTQQLTDGMNGLYVLAAPVGEERMNQAEKLRTKALSAAGSGRQEEPPILMAA